VLTQQSTLRSVHPLSNERGDIQKLDGKYSERVQLPAKAITEFFDRYFHIPLPIVTKQELGLFFIPRNLPIKFCTNSSTIFLVIVVTDKQTDRHTDTQTNAGKTYSLAFAEIKKKIVGKT